MRGDGVNEPESVLKYIPVELLGSGGALSLSPLTIAARAWPLDLKLPVEDSANFNLGRHIPLVNIFFVSASSHASVDKRLQCPNSIFPLPLLISHYQFLPRPSLYNFQHSTSLCLAKTSNDQYNNRSNVGWRQIDIYSESIKGKASW